MPGTAIRRGGGGCGAAGAQSWGFPQSCRLSLAALRCRELSAALGRWGFREGDEAHGAAPQLPAMGDERSRDCRDCTALGGTAQPLLHRPAPLRLSRTPSLGSASAPPAQRDGQRTEGWRLLMQAWGQQPCSSTLSNAAVAAAAAAAAQSRVRLADDGHRRAERGRVATTRFSSAPSSTTQVLPPQGAELLPPAPSPALPCTRSPGSGLCSTLPGCRRRPCVGSGLPEPLSGVRQAALDAVDPLLGQLHVLGTEIVNAFRRLQLRRRREKRW